MSGPGPPSGTADASLTSEFLHHGHERKTRGALDLDDRLLVIVREGRVIVRAALEQHAFANRLLEESPFGGGIVEPDLPHGIESRDGDADNTARLYGCVDRPPHGSARPA